MLTTAPSAVCAMAGSLSVCFAATPLMLTVPALLYVPANVPPMSNVAPASLSKAPVTMILESAPMETVPAFLRVALAPTVMIVRSFSGAVPVGRY